MDSLSADKRGSLVSIGNEKMKKATATLPPISPAHLKSLNSSLADDGKQNSSSPIISRSHSRHSSISSSHNSNIPKLLEMMAGGGAAQHRSGSDFREQRRQSQNVYDAVDLTATLMAMTHHTVDLNTTKSIDDVMKSKLLLKRDSSFSSNMMDHEMGEDLDVQVCFNQTTT